MTAVLLTPREVSDILRVSTTTLWRWRQSTAGPAWIDVAGQPRYVLADIEGYIEERRSR